MLKASGPAFFFKISLSILFLLLGTPALSPLSASEEDETAAGESFIEARMGSTLWETLIDNGVNPTLWKYVFDYNRANNPAFARITSASRIPKGTVIFIPGDQDSNANITAIAPKAGSSKAVVQDTIPLLGGVFFLSVTAGRGQRLNEVLGQLCVPASVKDSRERANMLRSIRSDMRDYYRRMGRKLNYRDRSFLVPLHLVAERHVAFKQRLDAIFSSPESFTPRDSILAISPDDIPHTAAEGESYRSIALRYLGNAAEFPSAYPFRASPADHISYMAQQIRHYNLNQPVWPGKTYFIPSYLVRGKYYEDNLPVKLERRTKEALYYSNGLILNLANHVTRNKTYWRRREKYLPPIGRRLADGGRAYPDMLVWHRTGLEPEIEEILRAKGKRQYSLRYIYRMSVTNYYIDENAACFLIVDPEKNPRDHAGNPADYRCFWNGQERVSDVSIAVEIESGFFGDLSLEQLSTAKKLQEVIRSYFIIPPDRILDHRKIASRRGPDLRLVRGRKADGLTARDRGFLGIDSVLDPDVLRGIVSPNLDEIQQLQADSTDYWFRVEIDLDLENSARMTGWWLGEGLWHRPGSRTPGQ